jgi:hypothetical protein
MNTELINPRSMHRYQSDLVREAIDGLPGRNGSIPHVAEQDQTDLALHLLNQGGGCVFGVLVFGPLTDQADMEFD